MNFRTCRAVRTPVIRHYRVVIGWECTRPFAAIENVLVEDAYTWDEDGVERLVPAHDFVENRWVKGGCRVFMGEGCEYECAGCYAHTSAYETLPEGPEGWPTDEVETDADWLGLTIGHGPRCPYPDGVAAVAATLSAA